MSEAKAPHAAWARAPGTCGELVQGWLDSGPFHITCPIDMHAAVEVRLSAGHGEVIAPADCPKTAAAVRATLAYLDTADLAAHLSVRSPLPRGKGMASSTADVAAAIAATGYALGRELTPDEIARIAVQVEPSDGLMFPGIALFDHRRGTHFELLGIPPPMSILVLDFGGAVDTLAFNAQDLVGPLLQREGLWRRCIDMVREGIRRGDPLEIGSAATLDTVAYAEIVPSLCLNRVQDLAKRCGAAGVNTAHSGTVMGLLFPRDPEALLHAERIARECFPGLEALYRCDLISGGVQTAASPALPGTEGRPPLKSGNDRFARVSTCL